MSGYVALEIDQYAHFERTIIIRSSNGTPQNLTGATARSQLRKSFYSQSSNTLITTITDDVGGEITLSMSSSNTGNLTPARYMYDVVVTHSTGENQRILEGIIVVNPGVTR